ncbi:mitochondrial ribonuclease P catalytic subunit [Rhinophrynus dorsalis]
MKSKNVTKSSSPQIFNVFSAGAAKKRNLMQNKAEILADTESAPLRRGQVIIPSVPLAASEWSRLKEENGRTRGFEEFMMMQMISKDTDINVAKSLLTFAAKENCGISYKLLLKYLAICVKQNQITEMYDVYDIMKDRFKSFDTGAYTLFIKGFSQTDRWRESIDMLDALKKTVIPSPRNFGDCIQGAIQHNEEKLAWTMYNEMVQAHLTPCEDTIQCLFNAGRHFHNPTYRNELTGVLNYFRDHQIYPGESLMQSMKAWFESIPNEGWRGQVTTVSNSGHCQACKQQLESIDLEPQEYSALKDVFLRSVVEGRDTFRKTTPQELQEFQQFVRSRPPYDLVVDGLNVAHICVKGIRSQTLLDVVTSLAAGGKRVLVLGRKHMLQESKAYVRRHIQLLQQRADCFFLDNISEDDPFLLYASLNSGSHCCFLTRDLMRDHKACLPDAQTKRLFFKWQRGHQLVLPFYTPGSRVHLHPIESYDTILQSTDVSWHIPYDKVGVDRASFEVPKTWLCLQKKH